MREPSRNSTSSSGGRRISASSLKSELRVAQTFAVYRTGASPTHGWPGCVGAVKQPVGATPKDARRLRNAIQRNVLAACSSVDSNMNGGMPAIFFQEALHGAEGDTIFPSPAAMGSSWEPSLLERVLTAVAAGARALGSHVVLAPVLDLFVDPRFGRLQEGFGEDPMHVAAFARSAAFGLQGAPAASGSRSESGGRALSANSKSSTKTSSTYGHKPKAARLGEDGGSGGGERSAEGSGEGAVTRRVGRLRPHRVYAIAKHFVGYGAVAGGLNGGASTADSRSLLEDHLRPWRAFTSAGGAGAMVGHHAALGVPLHANADLIRGVLRSRLALPGPVFSDCNDIGGLVAFRVAANRTAAAAAAMSAGVDVDLQCGRHCPGWQDAFGDGSSSRGVSSSGGDSSGGSEGGGGSVGDCGAYFELPRALESGMIPPSAVRAAASRILNLKSSSGLLRMPLEPVHSESEVVARLDSPSNHALAMLAAARGIVLLRNERAMLPLSVTHRKPGASPLRIAVIGPAAGCGKDGEGGRPGALCSAQRMMLGSYASPLSARRVRVPTLVSALRSLATAQEAGNSGEGGDGIGTDGMGRGAVVSFAIGARVDVAITADDAPRSQGATGLEAAVELGAVGTAAARSAARRAREEAAQLARRSDVVILALGDTSRTAGEWADRSSLELAGDQPALLAALLNVGTPVVLVVVGGRPVTFGGPSGDTMLQTANLSSLLFTYPPGQEGGTALARAILGFDRPGGRLAHAWPRRAEPSNWLVPTSGKWRTHAWEGRWEGGRGGRVGRGAADSREQPWRYGSYIDGPTSPLFPFGFGLSYGRCVLRSLSLTSSGPRTGGRALPLHLPIVARVEIGVDPDSESGARSASSRSFGTCSEVVQCYVRDPPAKHVRRWQRLVGFERVELSGHGAKDGARRLLSIELTSEALSVLDDDGRWRVRQGTYVVGCGRSSADPQMLKETITV